MESPTARNCTSKMGNSENFISKILRLEKHRDESSARQRFDSFERKSIAPTQEKAGDLLAKLAIERGIRLGELHRHIPAGKPQQRRQFRPAFLRQIIHSLARNR